MMSTRNECPARGAAVRGSAGHASVVLRACVVTLALLLFASCVTTEGDLFETVVSADYSSDESASDGDSGSDTEDKADEDGDDDSETPDDEDASEDGEEPEEPTTGFRIETEPRGAAVYVDREYVGKTPILIDLKPGTYDVRLTKLGYYDEAFEVDYAEGEYRTYTVPLREITGYLHVSTRPTNADIRIDGASTSQGVTELPVGTYTVSIRAFGYEPVTRRVVIRERRTTEIEVALLPAELTIDSITASRKVLNPRNPGRLGEVTVAFDVTTFGTGTAVITDEAGDRVRTIILERFETWEQQFTWSGSDESQEPVSDGIYFIRVEAESDRGKRVETRPVTVEVSREAVITYRSGWTGVAGQLYAPTAEMLPPSSFQLSTVAGGTVTETAARVPIQAFLRVPASDAFEIGVQGSVILNGESSVPFSGGVSVTYDVSGAADGTAPVGLAAYGVATVLARTRADTQTNYTGVRGGMVTTLRSGPLRLSAAVELAASPHAVTYASTPTEPALALWSYGRLGVMVDTGGFVAGVSTAVRSRSFLEGIAVQLPFAMGAEIHWLIPETYVMLSAIAFSEFESKADYYVSWGGGLGIVY